MQYLSFCDYLISLNIMSSRFIHVVVYCGMLFFLRLNNVPLYVYIPFLYPFICWWIFRLFPHVDNCEQFYNENFVLKSLKILISIRLDVYLDVGLLNHMEVLIFWGTTTLFSILTLPFYIPTNSPKRVLQD